MAKEVFFYSKSKVSKAGKFISNPENMGRQFGPKSIEALKIINNFRAAHSFPLNTFQVTLRKKSLELDKGALVAQRLKRLPTIVDKLARYPKMDLSRMQDIGGCRSIVENIELVNGLRDKYKQSNLKHKLISVKDYIENPKESGYRGIHLIYKYHSPRNETYNGLNIEIQLRSRLQHAWSTAVETAGMLLKQQFKSSQGQNDWLRFFQIVSKLIAHDEGANIISTFDRKGLLSELTSLESKIHACDLLDSVRIFDESAEVSIGSGAEFFVLLIDIERKLIRTKSFNKNEQFLAQRYYFDVEELHQSNSNIETVLVSVSSINQLKSAYPNYFGDTSLFLNKIESFRNE